jgi:hypothetical protein
MPKGLFRPLRTPPQCFSRTLRVGCSSPLDSARVFGVAGHTHQLRTRVMVSATDRGPCAVAATYDERDEDSLAARESLREAKDADVRPRERRLEARLALLALDALTPRWR